MMRASAGRTGYTSRPLAIAALEPGPTGVMATDHGGSVRVLGAPKSACACAEGFSGICHVLLRLA
ncbi:hypothetical protein SBV1_2470017 [Verrucomicrobia bacterium]|nr:hypothetical protein SBV1_2470017 [Verrucomicrobiota bacterium]